MDREVGVWRVELDRKPSAADALYGLLSEDERRRLARLRFEEDQRRFIVAHGALRALVGHCLDRPPGQIRFVRNPFGKPTLSSEYRTALTFNLSHSRGLALIAIASDANVGVDVEYVTEDAETLEIAHHWFSAAETLELRRMPSRRREQAFFDLWTRKEAWAKARGDGLSMPASVFAAGPEDDWSVFSLRPAPGYVGALAIKGSEWQLREWRWDAGVPSGNDLML